MHSRLARILVVAYATLAAAVGHSAELADPEQIESYLAGAVEAHALPGLVALVVDEDEILYLSAHGQRNVGGDLPMSTDTIFRIASMTKPVDVYAGLR